LRLHSTVEPRSPIFVPVGAGTGDAPHCEEGP
jgi:hypothetical protein